MSPAPHSEPAALLAALADRPLIEASWEATPVEAWRRAGRSGGRDVSLRVDVLLAEGRPDEALAAIKAPDALLSPALLRRLADALPAREQRADRVDLLQRLLAIDMATATSPYARELADVREILGLLPEDRRRPWLALLRGTYAAKRNFIAGLPPA